MSITGPKSIADLNVFFETQATTQHGNKLYIKVDQTGSLSYVTNKKESSSLKNVFKAIASNSNLLKEASIDDLTTLKIQAAQCYNNSGKGKIHRFLHALPRFLASHELHKLDKSLGIYQTIAKLANVKEKFDTIEPWLAHLGTKPYPDQLKDSLGASNDHELANQVIAPLKERLTKFSLYGFDYIENLSEKTSKELENDQKQIDILSSQITTVYDAYYRSTALKDRYDILVQDDTILLTSLEQLLPKKNAASTNCQSVTRDLVTFYIEGKNAFQESLEKFPGEALQILQQKSETLSSTLPTITRMQNFLKYIENCRQTLVENEKLLQQEKVT